MENNNTLGYTCVCLCVCVFAWYLFIYVHLKGWHCCLHELNTTKHWMLPSYNSSARYPYAIVSLPSAVSLCLHFQFRFNLVYFSTKTSLFRHHHHYHLLLLQITLSFTITLELIVSSFSIAIIWFGQCWKEKKLLWISWVLLIGALHCEHSRSQKIAKAVHCFYTICFQFTKFRRNLNK